MPEASVSFSILMFVSIFCLLVLTFFVVKLIISVTKLTDNANVIATNVKQEIEPTLKELKEAAGKLHKNVDKTTTLW